MARNTLEMFIKAKDLASRDIKAVEKSADNLKKSTDNVNTSTKITTASLKNLAVASVATATALGIKGVNDYAKFEKKMREVNTLIGSNEASFKRLSGQVETLSTTLGVDATESAGALYQAISAGVPERNALSFLEIATKSAIGGITDTETAVDGLTTILNAFKLPAEDTQAVADAMFATVKQGKTTFDELSRSMFQAGPIASALGVDFQDVLGATATLTKQGTPTSVAMTQIRASLTALSAPSTEMARIFEKLNVKGFDELLKREGSLIKVFQALRTATGDSKEQLQKMFGSVEAVGAVLGTTGKNAQTASGDLDAVTNSAGSANTAFEEMDKSASRGLAKINAFLDDMSRGLGETLIPIVETLVDKINDLRGVIAGKTKNELEEELDKVTDSLEDNVLQIEKYEQKLKDLKEKGSEFAKINEGSYKRELERLKKINGELITRSDLITDELDKLDGYVGAYKKKKKAEDDADGGKGGKKGRSEKKKEDLEEEIDLEMDADDMVLDLMKTKEVNFDEHLKKKAEQKKAHQEELRSAEDEYEAERDEKFKARMEAKKQLELNQKNFRETIMGDLAGVVSAFGGKETIAYKGFASAQAVMNTALAVTKALTLGPIIGPIKAGLIGAMGVAQIAKINGAKFHDGGLVKGAGEVPAILQSGEFVISRSATSRAGIENLQAINEGRAGSGVNVVNFIDTDQLDNYLSSRKGQKAVLNSIELD